ncbi:MAG TPA: molybdopterin-synthase adenylyltransferase MoeB [Alphaproteobacteria bacterium]|jgi:adenylyltransferase/sulfurtransferase|nr:molybdopterin-synthase adenylyltransferase MoeB [Alphaproteobacteria bacterium]
MDFTESQLKRYARHIILPEIGGIGQERLLKARVLVVGAGGLGSPLLLYLAAAGIGTLGVVDYDRVDLTNLQRQVVHGTGDLGRLKVESAIEAVARINPEVKVEAHAERLTGENVRALIAGYDIVADGTDNFDARYLLNDACHFANRTLVSAALLRFDGQLSTFKSWAGPPHPCYRCLFREKPEPGLIPSCSEAGILGSLAGTMGTLQATEVAKEILGIGRSLSGRMLLYDALEGTFRLLSVPRDPDCPLCGDSPTITEADLHG